MVDKTVNDRTGKLTLVSRFLVKVVVRDLYGMEARVLSDVEVNATVEEEIRQSRDTSG